MATAGMDIAMKWYEFGFGRLRSIVVSTRIGSCALHSRIKHDHLNLCSAICLDLLGTDVFMTKCGHNFW